MTRLSIVLIVVLSASAGIGMAQESQPHAKGEVRDTVGLISEEVAKQRLEMQGYTNVQVTKKDLYTLEISATKDSMPVFLEMHPKHGTVRDVTASRLKQVEHEGVLRQPDPNNK